MSILRRRTVEGRKPKAYGAGQEEEPNQPPALEDEAKKEWKRMAKQLEHLGILTESGNSQDIVGSICEMERGKRSSARDHRKDERILVLVKGGAG